MVKRKSGKDDITKVGIGALEGLGRGENFDTALQQYINRRNNTDTMAALPYFRGEGVRDPYLNSPEVSEPSQSNNFTPLGESYWDDKSFMGDPQDVAQNFMDTRAERQPWWSKILNGVGKAGVLAVTTAAELGGLIYGIGQGTYNAVTNDSDKTNLNAGGAFLHGLWDNPITNALQNINEFSEKWMPNYYTRDEQENPFSNIFTANFIGDKIIKNLGFMVGAFYSGIPGASLLGKAGTAVAKYSRAANIARGLGEAKRVSELEKMAGSTVENVSRLSTERAGQAVGKKLTKAEREGAEKLDKLLTDEGLTEAERGERYIEGMDRTRKIAGATRTTTQALGALGSAINEGAVEAINNSKDWANLQKQRANDKYQQRLEEIEAQYGDSNQGLSEKVKAAEEYQKTLVEIEKGRARVGNADLLLNIPILTASNAFQLSKLYVRGFDSTRREMKNVLGSLAKGDLRSSRTKTGAVLSALAKSNSEGMEEYLQRAASDGAGQAVADSIERYINSGKDDGAKNDVVDYIKGFGQAIADNAGDSSAWEEYFVGAVSSLLGMPVFGSQTKNAYIGKNGPIGLAGGLVGNYQDYMVKKEHEDKVTKYLNKRINDPNSKFKPLYENLIKTGNLDKLMNDALNEDDKAKYKELEFEKLFNDINAAASVGKLEEFKALIGYNKDYSEKELKDIVKETSKTITADEQREQDENAKSELEEALETYTDKVADNKATKKDKRIAKKAQKLLDATNKRLKEDKYKDKQVGPFINRNGAMDVQVDENGVKGGKMIDILNRNREHVLDTIDQVLKIRNDIDIESDGRLDDTQINLLTQMRAKIWDYDRRSADMAYDLVTNLGDIKDTQEKWKAKSEKQLEKAQEKYDKAVKKAENAKGKNAEKAEKEKLSAEKELKEAKASVHGMENVLKLLDILTEQKEMTSSEKRAFKKGYGAENSEGIGKVNQWLGINDQTPDTRPVNSEEAQAILSNVQNARVLATAVLATKGLDSSTARRLVREINDLNNLANQKIAYNEKLREFLGENGGEKINEAFQNAEDKLSQKEKDNKADELALRIQNVDNMTDLDNVLRESAQVSPEITKLALAKAKQNGDEDTKRFIADYEKATDFYGNFSRLTVSLPNEVQAGIGETAQSAWEYALENGTDVYDTFTGALKDAADDLEKNDNPTAKETGKAIKKILSDLNASSEATATNKNARKATVESKKNSKKEENNEEEHDESDDELHSALAEIKNKGKGKKKEEPEIPTKESIDKKIRQAIKDSMEGDFYSVTKIADLSKELQDKINKYNELNPDGKIDDAYIANILQDIVDDDIIDDGIDEIEDDGSEVEDGDTDNGNGKTRKEAMQSNLRVSFKSDHPTKFRFNLDHRVPYDPDGSNAEQLQAIQELLEEYKAYQFVDKNYLGYVAADAAKRGEEVTIHFLKSTDAKVDGNGGSEATIFMAIEWDKNAEKAVREHGFNGREDVNISDEVHPVTVDGKKYQIVGVLSLNTQVAKEVSDAFGSLQTTLNGELNPKMEEARNNGQQFVISDLTTYIDQIYTGRLEKRNDEDDKGEKVSLYDFMTSKQGKDDRRTSTEWESGMDFYFGAVIGEQFLTNGHEELGIQYVKPNDTWASKNNGNIVMFIPKPDGKFYPVRVSRRTVGKWLKSNADGTHTGEQLLDGVLDGSIENQFIGNIVSLLKTLFDEHKENGPRVQAKQKLSKYFIFGKHSPIHFDGSNVKITIDKVTESIDPDAEVNDKIKQFFNFLNERNVMFSLPITREAIKSKDIITSGAFEIGLRSFYNFNANFTVKPIDGNGIPLEIKSEPETPTGSENINKNKVEFDLGDGIKTYIMESDSTFTLDGKPVDADKQNILTIAMRAEQGQAPSYLKEAINSRKGYNKESQDYIFNNIGDKFDGIYVIHAEEDWVYDSRFADHNKRLYKLDSEQGEKLRKEVNAAIIKFCSDNVINIKALQKDKPKSVVSQLIDHIKNKLGIKVHGRKDMEKYLKEHGYDDLQEMAEPIEDYHNREKASENEIAEILEIIKAKKYNKSGTDAVTIDSNGHQVIYLIDHSADNELYENLKDGDGFGIREAISLDDLDNDKVREIIRNIGADYNNSEKSIRRQLQNLGIGSKYLSGIDIDAELKVGTSSDADLLSPSRGKRKKVGYNPGGFNGRKSKKGTGTEKGNGASSVEQLFETPDGEVFGFVTKDGEMYLDETKISPEHPIHEYTHLWDRTVAKKNPKLWKRGVELMKKTSLWKDIVNDDNYGKKWKADGMSNEDFEFMVASEVHARLVGQEGAKRIEELEKSNKEEKGIIAKLKQWLLDVWKDLKTTFSNWSKEEIDKLKLEDFNTMTVRDFADAVNLKEAPTVKEETIKKEAPSTPPSPQGSTQTGRFSGKELKDLDANSNDKLTLTLVKNYKKPFIKDVLEALQFAEASGTPIDDDAVIRGIEKVFSIKGKDKKAEKDMAKAELLNEIKGC